MSLVNQCPAARSLARSRSRYLEVIRPVAYLARIRPFPSPQAPRAWPDLLGAVNYRLRPCFYAHGPMFLSQQLKRNISCKAEAKTEQEAQ